MYLVRSGPVKDTEANEKERACRNFGGKQRRQDVGYPLTTAV